MAYMSAKHSPKLEKKSPTTIRAAVAMALAGYDYGQIAERFDYSSPFAAKTSVELMLGETVGEEDVKALRNKSLARKERLLSSLWWDATHPYLLDEDGKVTDQANERFFSASDRAARLTDSIDRLLGLNAPTQVEIYRPDTEEFLGTLAAMRQKILEGMPEEGDIFDVEVLDEDEEGSDAL